MIQLNSFISSFRQHKNFAECLRLIFWILIFLGAIDLMLNILFAYPQDPQVTKPHRLSLYFDYGRSTEGKLKRMTGDSPANTAPITLVGWYDNIKRIKPLKIVKMKGSKRISIYGMSHAMRLSQAFSKVSNNMTVRAITAPSATANWAYGAYLRDKEYYESDIVVLTFMTLNFPMITTCTGLTWNPDLPVPYTYDRFYVSKNKLKRITPIINNFYDYSKLLRKKSDWISFKKYLAKHDEFYNPFIFEESVFDQSSLFRLLRRAYAQRVIKNRRNKVLNHNHRSMNTNNESIDIALQIISAFSANARENNALPVVYIVNNLGFDDLLYQLLLPAIEKEKILVLSSHTVHSPNDASGYLPDSHFTDEVDEKLARELVRLISQCR